MKPLPHISFFLFMFVSTALCAMENPDNDRQVSLLRRSSSELPSHERNLISSRGHFFFIDPALNEIPGSTANVPLLSAKISSEEWKKVDNFLEEAVEVVLRSPFVKASQLWDVHEQCYKPTFSKYYELYQMISSNNRGVLKKIKEDLNQLLNPLGNFVAVFESLFDTLKTHYKEDINNYVIHKDRLERDIFPIVQSTFNTFMRIYEKHAPDKIEEIGPLKNESQYWSISIEGFTKYVFYKQDINGGFLLFTVFSDKKIGENLFNTYVPYLHSRNPSYAEDSLIFSFDEANLPMLEEHPGLIISRNRAGYLITPYRGNTTSIPYTTAQSMLLQNPSTHKKTETIFNLANLKTKNQKLPSEQKFLEDESFDRVIESVVDDLPSELKNSPLTVEHVANDRGEAMKVFVENLLGKNDDCIFFPFPRTDREVMEETYLFLLDFKERIRTQTLQPADAFLLTYLEEATFPEKNLEQIIQEYEEELIEDYTKEEEKIRLEQEARRRMVASGELNEKQPKFDRKKPSYRSKKEKDSRAKNAISMKDGTANTNDPSLESPKEKARKKLEELKSLNKNGSLKFRKFMQLVNVARQGLVELDVTLKAELNKSSHGKLDSLPLVRPHGNAKEKSLSSSRKKQFLSNLIEMYLQKLENSKK